MLSWSGCTGISRWLGGFSGLVLAGLLRLSAAEPDSGVLKLQQELDTWCLEAEARGASVGLLARWRGGDVVHAHDPDRLLSPASTLKLLTAARTLAALGPDYRFQTRLSAPKGPDPNGILTGPLVIQGGGDPSWHGHWYPGNSLAPITRALQEAGVRQIHGEVRWVRRIGDGLPAGGWAWNDLAWGYGAAPSSLAVDRSSTVLTLQPGAQPGDPVGISWEPGPPPHPVRFQLETGPADAPLKFVLRRTPEGWLQGIQAILPAGGEADVSRFSVGPAGDWFQQRLASALVQGRWLESPSQVSWQEARDVPEEGWERILLSPPLHEILRHMLHESDNWEARMLELALENSDQFLAEPMGFFVHDGAGLSRGNLASARGLVSLLDEMESLAALLPVAGHEGTLKNRFQGRSAEGVLRGKSGSLRFVRTLAGTIPTREGAELVFAILLNHDRGVPERDEPTGTEWVDRCAGALADFALKAGPFARPVE